MSKFSIMIVFFFIVLFQFAAASKEDDLKWCPKSDVFNGGCGDQQCLLEFLGKYGARSMPKSCVCTPFGVKHHCSCQVVCGCC
ncbi:Putative defensin-like protein 244 [Linum perenne]